MLTSLRSTVPGNLVLRLLVAVHNHAIDQTARFAIGFRLVLLSLFDFFIDVAGGFLVGFVVLIEVCWEALVDTDWMVAGLRGCDWCGTNRSREVVSAIHA